MTEVLSLRSRGVFVARVLAVYALARVVTTTILLLVMQHQVPSGMTGGDDVPVSYFPFTALWDGQWYQTIAQHGYPSELPVGESGAVQQNPWAFYPLFPYLAKVERAIQATVRKNQLSFRKPSMVPLTWPATRPLRS